MNDILQQKIKSLPPTVYDYLTSIKSDDLNVLIVQKYGFDLPRIRAYADLIPQLFLKEIPVASLVNECQKIFGLSDNVARQLACDIAGVRLLVVADWLTQDVAGLIKSWGGDPAKYNSHVEVQKRAVVREKDWFAKQMAEPGDPEDYPPLDPTPEEENEEEVDWNERGAKIKDLFSGNFVQLLRLEDDLVREINADIFYIISNQAENFAAELANKLLNNQEVLTPQTLVVSGKQAAGTIGNWLAYFLAEKGSIMFDAVVLSDFLTNSQFVRELDEEDKNLVKNLLITYRNLKFFPESMPSDESSEWFFLPVTPQERPLTTPMSSRSQPTTPETKIVSKEPKFQPDLPTVNFNVSPAKQAQLMELKKILNNYPAGSLERMALEEEINRLQENS